MSTPLTRKIHVPGVAWAGLVVLCVAFLLTVFSDSSAYGSDLDTDESPPLLGRVLASVSTDVSDLVAPLDTALPHTVSTVIETVDAALPRVVDTVDDASQASVQVVKALTHPVTTAIAPVPGAAAVTHIVDTVVSGATTLISEGSEAVIALVPVALVGTVTEPVAETPVVRDIVSAVGGAISIDVIDAIEETEDAVVTPAVTPPPLIPVSIPTTTTPVVASANPAPSATGTGPVSSSPGTTPPVPAGSSSSASGTGFGSGDTPGLGPLAGVAPAESGRTVPPPGTAVPASPFFDTDVSPD